MRRSRQGPISFGYSSLDYGGERAGWAGRQSVFTAGVLAKSSGEQVIQIKEIAKRLGLEIADADEARQILALKGSENVNF